MATASAIPPLGAFPWLLKLGRHSAATPGRGTRRADRAVGPYLILRHLPVCEDSQEGIAGLVGECPAIVPEEGRPHGGTPSRDRSNVATWIIFSGLHLSPSFMTEGATPSIGERQVLANGGQPVCRVRRAPTVRKLDKATKRWSKQLLAAAIGHQKGGDAGRRRGKHEIEGRREGKSGGSDERGGDRWRGAAGDA